MITNQSKPNTSFSNTDKISNAETWASISTTWATEGRTWLECVSLLDNSRKPNTTLWDDTEIAWDSGVGWTALENIINVSKP